MAEILAKDERSLGGEMELSLDALCATELIRLPFHDQPYQTVTSGRTGIKLVAQALKGSSDGTWLLPATPTSRWSMNTTQP